MDLHLNNKTAVVTGATAGIGFAIAQVLLQEGATVIFPGRSQAKLDESAHSPIGSARLSTVHCDLATSEGANALIRELPEVDILVSRFGHPSAPRMSICQRRSLRCDGSRIESAC